MVSSCWLESDSAQNLYVVQPARTARAAKNLLRGQPRTADQPSRRARLPHATHDSPLHAAVPISSRNAYHSAAAIPTQVPRWRWCACCLRRQLRLRCCGCAIQIRQYPGDVRRIFDAGQHLEFSLPSGAAVNLNAEHPLQALRPSHSGMAGNGGLLVALSGLLPALAALRRSDCSAQTAVWREYAVVTRQVHAGRCTNAASRAIKSCCSTTMCVVPSRYAVFSG